MQRRIGLKKMVNYLLSTEDRWVGLRYKAFIFLRGSSMRQLFCSAVLLLATTFAHALQIVPYTPEKHAALQLAGQPHALHFHADWCGTCIEQDRALEKLKGDKSLDSVTLMVVDYDKNKALRQQLKVTIQSTFVVFKGQNEVARNGGETEATAIKSLLAKAL